MGRGCPPTRSAPVIVLGLSLVCLTGCGSKQPVTGKLVYADNEQPVKELKGFDVTFTSEKLGISARGTVQEDGTFQLGTEKDKDGCPSGEYVVTVSQPYPRAERPYLGDRVVDQGYEMPNTSDLRAEVKSSKNEFVFKLRRYVRGKYGEGGRQRAVGD
jgi:hypothetical protein